MNKDIFLYYFKIPKGALKVTTECLDASELARFEKISNEKRKAEFLYSRFVLKSILANNHGLQSVKVLHKKSGKPYMRGWKFNLSHSEGHVMLALSKYVEVGVDIEKSSPKKHFLDIAKSYFSPGENDFILGARSDAQKYKNFRKLWSFKEAYIKTFNGVLNRKTMRVYFDIPNQKIEKLPSKKPVTFYFNDQMNMALCCAGKISKKNIKCLTLKVSKSQVQTIKSGLILHQY